MSSKRIDYIALAIAELEKCGGHTDVEVEHALEVLEDLVVYGELPNSVADRIDDINREAFYRTNKAVMGQHAEQRLTSVSGLCYQKEDLSLACSQYLFETQHEIVDPEFATDTSKLISEESSHERWRIWYESVLFTHR